MAVCLPYPGNCNAPRGFHAEESLTPQAFSSPVKEISADIEPSRSVPHKLVRSVSSKLRRWCQRLEVDGMPADSEHAGQTRSTKETFAGIPRNAEEAQMDDLTTDNERWNMMACFGLQGRVARLAYVERDEAVEINPTRGKKNDAVATIGTHQDSPARQFRKDLDNLEAMDFHTRKSRAPLQDIARPDSAPLGADHDRPSGRYQCGCFANGGIDRLKGWGSRRGESYERTFGTEVKWTEINENASAGGNFDHSRDLASLEVVGKSREALQGISDADSRMDDSGSGRQNCGCFANGGIERLREWGSKKGENCARESLQIEIDAKSRPEHPGLPDEVIEMCLARTPFSTLATARLVCKKWRSLTMSPHFLALREILCSRKPWLLLFGLSKDGTYSGEIHALDPTFDKWHSIRADMLSGRFLFSVASFNGLVYIIGGCSNSPNRRGRSDKTIMKTHKSVLVYNPLGSSWTKLCSMGTARAMPVTGVFQLRDGRIDRGTSSRSFGSYRYEEPNWKSESGRGWCNVGASGEISNDRDEQAKNQAWELAAKTFGSDRHLHHNQKLPGSEMDSNVLKMKETHYVLERSSKESKSYGLIVVGGQGIWNEPLFTAEVYDPVTNTWREIAKLPADHGVTCAGVVCNGLFYAYSETDKLAAYDFDLNIWTSVQLSKNLTRLHEYIPKLVSCKGKVLLLGVAWGGRETDAGGVGSGGNGVEKAIRMMWELNPSLQTWLQCSWHPDAPLDWNAVFVSDGEHIFGVEMFKIFGQVLDFVTVCDLSTSQVKWERVSRMRIGNDLDVSSCITKTAVLVQL